MVQKSLKTPLRNIKMAPYQTSNYSKKYQKLKIGEKANL